MQAANLAAERLAYFRACPNPYIAVGGTFYPAPENPRTHRDHNSSQYWNTPAPLHNVWNARPILLVREWLYGLEQGSARSNSDTLSRKFAAVPAGGGGNTVNVVPPTPDAVRGPNPGDGLIDVAGVYPDWFNAGARGPQIPQERELLVNPGAGGQTVRGAFVPAPMANEELRGVALAALPRQVQFVREVWVQTNHPLGRPFGNADETFVANRDYRVPAIYADGGIGRTRLNFGRTLTAVGGDGGLAMDVPLWVVTVTVRVFLREPTIQSLVDVNSVRAGESGDQRWRGVGYDPNKPLSTMIGYFSLRRNF